MMKLALPLSSIFPFFIRKDFEKSITNHIVKRLALFFNASLILGLLAFNNNAKAQTFFGVASSPADGASLATTPVSITPPNGMQSGDLVIIFAHYRNNNVTMTMNQTGGQTWTSEANYLGTNTQSSRIFWCRFNGTWAADPSINMGSSSTTAVMYVFRPTAGTSFWAINVAQQTSNVNAALQTMTGVTTTWPNTVTGAFWSSENDNTWGSLTGTGWSKAGLAAQYRNIAGNDQSTTAAYNIQTGTGATGDVAQTQSASESTNRHIISWYEIKPPTIGSLTPSSACKNSDVVVTGTNFQGTTAVTVNGTTASFVVNSTTQMTVIVPASATTGNLVVTNAAGSALSSLTIIPNQTAGAASSTPTLCINTALTPITHSTAGATGIGSPTGLPSGVTATWATNTITISGTPTASGTFNYSIPLTGGCGSVNATGTITATANNTAGSPSSTPTLCTNTVLTNITIATTGATGISNSGVFGANGLPAGVSATWASNTITISGTPTASGTFNYSIPLTGGCGSVNAMGTITVNASPNTSGLTATSLGSCNNGGIPITVSSSNLISGIYTVTYNLTVSSGSGSVIGATASMVFTAGSPGTGTFTTVAHSRPSATVTIVSLTLGSCLQTLSPSFTTSSINNNALPDLSNPITVSASGTDTGNSNGSTVTIITNKLTAGVSYKIFYTVTKLVTGTINSATNSTTITGVGTLFNTELIVGSIITNTSGTVIGTVAAIANNTSLTLSANAAIAVSNATYHLISINNNSKDVTFINSLKKGRIQGSFTTGQLSTIGQYKVYINSVTLNSTGCSSSSTLSATFQVISSWATVQDGLWDNPATWGNASGTGPDYANGIIRVKHRVQYDATSISLALELNELVIENTGTLIIESDQVLTIKNGTTPGVELDLEIQGAGKLQVGTDPKFPSTAIDNGTVNFEQGVTHSGTSSSTVEFKAGSYYNHLSTTSEGSPLLASWHSTSTFNVVGYTTASGNFTSPNWSQNFGNVIWNCTSQTGDINLNEKLGAGSIQGVLIISSTGTTGTGIVRLADDGTYSLAIGGDLTISGSARFSSGPTSGNGPNVTLTMQNLTYSSTSSGGSWLCDKGQTVVTISGNVLVSAGTLFMSSGGNTDRSATTMNLTGNLTVATSATLDASDTNNDREGKIIFTNSSAEHLYNTTGGTIQGRMLYVINANQIVRAVGESAFISKATGTSLTGGNQYGFRLLENAKLIVESTDPLGAIQSVLSLPTAVTGNIRVLSTSRYFASGSTIEYGRTTAAPQFISGAGHPVTAGINCIINNTSGVTVTAAGTVNVGGSLTISSGNLNVTESNLTVSRSTNTVGGNILVNTRQLSQNTTTLRCDGTINMTGGNIQFNSSFSVDSSNTSFLINGDVQASDRYFTFSGNNCRVTVGGTSSATLNFPVSGPISLEQLTINRSGVIVNMPQNLTLGNLDNLINSGLDLTNGSLDMNADLLVTTDATLVNGTLFFEDHNVELRRNIEPTVLTGLFSANSNSMLSVTSGFNGNEPDTLRFAPSGDTLGILLLNRSVSAINRANIYINTEVNIADTLKLTDGQFLNASGLTMLPGSVIARTPQATFFTGSLAPAGGPYDVIYDDYDGSSISLSSGIEIQGALLDDVTSNLSGTATLSASMTGSGALTINNVGTFTCVGFPVTMNSVFISNWSTLNAPSGANLTLTGNFTNNGTFNAGSGASAVVFDGVSTIGGSSITNFNHLTLNAAKILTAPARMQVKGHIVFNTGSTFNHSNGNVELNGTTLNSGELNQNITASNTVTPYPQTLTMNAESAAGNAKFWNITVDKPGVVGSVNLLVDELRLGQLLDIKSATTINTNDKLILLSQTKSTALDAGIGPVPVGAAINGNVEVQRFMGSTAYALFRYMASPVPNGVIPTNVVDKLYRYDAVTGTWIRNFGTMPVGEGYAALSYSPSDSRWSVKNPVFVGSFGDDEGESWHSLKKGWNLLGNPYPSAIKWEAGSDWSLDNVSTTIAITDNNVPGYPSYFRYLNRPDGQTWGTGGITNKVIAMGQSFWVYVGDTGGSLVIHESAKVDASELSLPGQFYRESISISDQLVLNINNGKFSDQAVLSVDKDSKRNARLEANLPKLWNPAMNIYLLNVNNTEMLTYTLKDIGDEMKIPVGIKVTDPGEYEISFNISDSFGYSLYLVDLYEGEAIPVSSNHTYKVTITDSSRPLNDRFYLSLTPDVQLNQETLVSVYPNPVTNQLNIEIKGQKGISQITLFDMNGRLLKSIEIKKQVIMDVSDFNGGFYILKVQTEQGIFVQKIKKHD